MATDTDIDPIEIALEADIAALQQSADDFVEKRHNKLNAAQAASLGKSITRLNRLKRTLEALRAAPPDVPEVEAIDIGDAPLPNNALPPDSTYGCEESAAAIEARHGGRSITTLYSEVVTGILRPDLDQWDALVEASEGNFSQSEANHAKQGSVLKQKAMIDYFAGKVPFSAIAGYLGPTWYKNLGCVPTLSAIHDLGAG
jgi:hypothetical protein